jgi:hypothetical protein
MKLEKSGNNDNGDNGGNDDNDDNGGNGVQCHQALSGALPSKKRKNPAFMRIRGQALPMLSISIEGVQRKIERSTLPA